MIEIIQHGIQHEKYVKYKTSCYNCNCIFSFEREDINRIPSLFIGYVVCPECNTSLKLLEDNYWILEDK